MRSLAEGSLDAAQVRANKQKLTILLVMPLIVLALAYIVFYTGVGIPSSTTNRGELITPPLQVIESGALNLDGSEYTYPPIWHMMIPISNTCAQTCLDTLHVTRQVHLRQGKRSIDIDRVFVSDVTLSPTLVEKLKAQHPHSVILTIPHELMTSISERTGYIEGDYFLVDPQGWLMMAYRQNHTGEDLLKDLKRLLK